MRLIAALALAAAFAPTTPDPRIGTWTLTSAQSTIDPANRLSITPVPNGVHLVMSGEVHLDFTARNDGHGTAVEGNPGFNQIELHRIGKRASEVKEMKGGAPVATVREEISKDGKELTISTLGTKAGQAKPNRVSVWERSGGVTVANNPSAGEWTQNLGKSRMRQGLVLTIQPSGGDGVRFSGDYSYTGRFDGKPYNLQNSRNDTVQLALADPRTVEATYKRDNQVSQQDRWVLSADGHTLTLTSKATLENGQHLSETLVFQKP